MHSAIQRNLLQFSQQVPEPYNTITTLLQHYLQCTQWIIYTIHNDTYLKLDTTTLNTTQCIAKLHSNIQHAKARIGKTHASMVQ